MNKISHVWVKRSAEREAGEYLKEANGSLSLHLSQCHFKKVSEKLGKLHIADCIWTLFFLDDEGEILLYFLLDTVSAFFKKSKLRDVNNLLNYQVVSNSFIFSLLFLSVLFWDHKVMLSYLFSVSGTDESFLPFFLFLILSSWWVSPKPIADKLLFSLESSHIRYHQGHVVLCLRHGCWAAAWLTS